MAIKMELENHSQKGKRRDESKWDNDYVAPLRR